MKYNLSHTANVLQILGSNRVKPMNVIEIYNYLYIRNVILAVIGASKESQFQVINAVFRYTSFVTREILYFLDTTSMPSSFRKVIEITPDIISPVRFTCDTVPTRFPSEQNKFLYGNWVVVKCYFFYP